MRLYLYSSFFPTIGEHSRLSRRLYAAVSRNYVLIEGAHEESNLPEMAVGLEGKWRLELL